MTDVSASVISKIESAFGATTWTNTNGVLQVNPHPNKIVLVCDNSGSTVPDDLDDTWAGLMSHYHAVGYTTQALLNKKFTYGVASECINSKDGSAGRPSPDEGSTSRTLHIGGGVYRSIRIEHIPVVETWQSLSLYMFKWVQAHS